MHKHSRFIGQVLAQIGRGLFHLVARVAEHQRLTDPQPVSSPQAEGRHQIVQAVHWRHLGLDTTPPAGLDDHRVARRIIRINQIAAGHTRRVEDRGRQGDALQGDGRIDLGFLLMIPANLFDAAQQTAQVIAARAVVEEVDLVEDDGSKRRKQAAARASAGNRSIRAW